MSKRPLGELVVLMLVGTVCTLVVIGGLTIGLMRLIRPEVNVTSLATALSGTVNTLLGLMAGLLAGRRRGGGKGGSDGDGAD